MGHKYFASTFMLSEKINLHYFFRFLVTGALAASRNISDWTKEGRSEGLGRMSNANTGVYAFL